MIAIIAGCGTNIASIQFALDRLGVKSVLTSEPSVITAANHVILPGVGTAKHAMSQLHNMQLIDTIRQLKQPVLGICLGMQLLFESSEEGNVDGLGIVPGKIRHLTKGTGLTIPHMGWNQITVNQASQLMVGINTGDYVYFVHSYAAPVNKNTLATTHYGESFASMVAKDNFYGVQFHPERSGKVGETILKNFIELQ